MRGREAPRRRARQQVTLAPLTGLDIHWGLNGGCYRSRTFAAALGSAKHRRTRPYRPQTNGKVERFNRTLAAEWAYARTYVSDEARAATYQEWLHHYNHHRPHTGIGGDVPADRVHNLTGNYS